MSLNWFYKLGDWNPQFFREFKGRLKPRNLAITVVTSLLAQTLVMAYFWLALPGNDTEKSNYCTGEPSYSSWKCLHDAAGNVIINWKLWWFYIFELLSWSLPFIVLIAGVYMLISDLGREERRGTLNFLRLSPQPSQSILLGKLLGVPIVPFLAVLLVLPLHWVSAVGAGVSINGVLSIYLFTLAVASCYFTGALLFAVLGGSQGWLGVLVVWFTFSIFFQYALMSRFGEYYALLPHQFFGVLIGDSLTLSVAFWLVTFGVATFWLWQAANRRFRNPAATPVSKRQSYLLTACFEFWLLGFVVRNRSEFEPPIHDLTVVALVNVFWFVILMAALMPQRQKLLDWARYRRERVSSRQQFWNHSVMKELIRGEKSPALLAISLNLLVAVAVFTPWILSWDEAGQKFQAFSTLLLGSMFVLICAAIAQLMMLMKTPKRTLLAAWTVGAIIFVPPVLLGLLFSSPEYFPIAWLVSAFAFAAIKHATAMEIFISFLAHLSVFSLLTNRLAHQLRKAGESETKALLAGSQRG
ncbi:MAG: hypothetical protein K6T90_07495 [Leptolyngbyaceae cyanobacterium HOT.MB2.61]|nr:hypothetical protein [Leptolyngbyaceae cyanobacterium HOT.MB2.61]